MSATTIILFFSFLLNLSSGYVLMDDDDNLDEVLMLPTEYNIKAERIDLINDKKLPLELWYDGATTACKFYNWQDLRRYSTDYNRSRVDVYNGMVRRYFYWGEDGATGNDGVVYMAYPKWTEEEGHTIYCSTTDMELQEPSDAFPAEEEYVYAGKTVHEGKNVDVWKYTNKEDDTKTELVLYSFRTERGVDVPVQIVKKEMNTMKGSIEVHVIFNYHSYNPLFCEDELDAEKEASCDWTPDSFESHMNMLHPVFHNDLDVAFNSFKKHHSREYQDNEEHEMRKQIFHRNWQSIVDHNQKNLGFKLALNHLADLTPAERARRSGGRRSSNPGATLTFPHSGEQLREIVTQIPEEYDMRLEGLISPVKDQVDCGSCWTFATAAAVEAALAKRDGRIYDLSEQSLVDCSWEGNNEGCSGGYPKEALKHIMKHGIPLEEDYGAYLAENGYCHLENTTELYKIRGFTMVTPLSVTAMKVALYKYGPVIVTLQTHDAFDFYRSGIVYDHTCEEDYVSHAVTVVGYGSRDGTDYWIVKNSYGQMWGEDGYALLSTLNNNCFVLNEPYYPVV